MVQIMTKRIPVSEEIWKRLGKMKEAGQTYDDLLFELMKSYNRKELSRKMNLAQKGRGNWTNLEDI
jgi:predicted CopG family antitoxin